MYDEDILKSILSLKIDQLTMHDNYGEMTTTTPNTAHNSIALVLMDLEQDVQCQYSYVYTKMACRLIKTNNINLGIETLY